MSPPSKGLRPNTKDHLSAILLAAGRSQRMGVFKPLLPFGHSTVIESCVEYLKQGGVAEIVVVTGHRADEIQKRLENAGVSFAINSDPDSEMAASIARGVEQLVYAAEATLIALTDQPAIPPSVVPVLTAEWRKGAKIVKPEFAGRGGHPVLVDLIFREELLNLDPAAGLRGFLAAHEPEVCRVPVDSPFIARDIDTWDDYLALHQEVFGFAPDSGP